MRLAPEGNIIIYPLFFILVISFGIDFIFSVEYLLFVNMFLLVSFIFCLNFFRDPKRSLPPEFPVRQSLVRLRGSFVVCIIFVALPCERLLCAIPRHAAEGLRVVPRDLNRSEES